MPTKRYFNHVPKIEIRLFLISFIGYLLLSLAFSVNTQLVFNATYICDLYLGFDNAAHDTSFLRHPLLKVVSFCFKNIFGVVNNPFIISVIISLVCSLLLALQNFFLFKILNKIIKLSQLLSILITLLFSFCGYNLLLSFTLDSYLFTTTALMAFFYVFSKYEEANKVVPAWIHFGSMLLVAGLTITNFLKTIIISLGLSSKDIRKIYLKRIGVLCILFLLPLFYFLDKAKTGFAFISTYMGQHDHLWNNTFNYFFGSIFLIPNVVVTNSYYINGAAFTNVVGGYHNYIGISLLLIIALLFTFIVIKKFRLKIVKTLLLCFSLDFFINVVLGLGLSEAYIFPGNYQFVFPLLLGVHLKEGKTHKYYYYLLLLALIILMILNIQQLYAIYQFGLIYYPS